MNLKMTGAAAIAAVMMAGGGASAGTMSSPTCTFGEETTGDVFNTTDCVGEQFGNPNVGGNNNGNNRDLNTTTNFDDGALFGSTSWVLDSKFNRDNSGFVEATGGRLTMTFNVFNGTTDLNSGTWSVDNWDGVAKATLVLKAATNFAAYLIDLSDRTVTSGGWETTALSNSGGNEPELSNVSLYTTPIPLPAAGWLMLAGLGGLAALRRRKTV